VARHIQKYQVSASHMVTGVLGATLTQNKVTAWHIGTDVIGSRHMGSDAVTGNHIAAAAVVASHVDVGAITKAKLGALAVSTAKVGTNMINSRLIASYAVTNTHLVSANVYIGRGTHGAAMGKLDGKYISVAFGAQGVTVDLNPGLGRSVNTWWVADQDKPSVIYKTGIASAQSLKLVNGGPAGTNVTIRVVVV
jgi:hypothetical protein